MERDVPVDLEGARGDLPAPVALRPALPAFTFPTTLPATPGDVPSCQVPTFPPRGREGGRALTTGAAAADAGRGERGRAVPAARRRRGAETARAGEPGPGTAARAPAAALPRPRGALPGFFRFSALTPPGPWSHKPAREEKGKERTQTALPPLPERRTRRRSNHHHWPSRPLSGRRGQRRGASDTNNNYLPLLSPPRAPGCPPSPPACPPSPSPATASSRAHSASRSMRSAHAHRPSTQYPVASQSRRRSHHEGPPRRPLIG